MILGLLRIKNEARWIERVLRSILPVCDEIVVMDDSSIDETVEICKTVPRVSVLPSPFTDLNECRDKNWLLDHVEPLKPEWIVAIDGDEVLQEGHQAELAQWMKSPSHQCFSLRVLYLWNTEDTVRMDGVYADFHRESVFRPNGARFIGNPAGFHCGNVPWGSRQKKKVLSVPLLHMGYLHKEDRIRKWKFYNAADPKNHTEGYDPRFPERGSYAHVVQGDIPEVPADVKLMHAGPLDLKPLISLDRQTVHG